MNVYITRINGLPLRDTSQYIQRMTAGIGHQLGFREMGIYRYNGEGESKESFNGRLDGIIAGISGRSDIVICQLPTGNGFKFEWGLINRLKAYRSKIIIFIHDSVSLFKETASAVLQEKIRLYSQADVLIVPSLAMQWFLVEHGINKNMKFVVQEMWDYITDMDFFRAPQFRKEIHYIGRNGFEGLDNWNREIRLKLYGITAYQGQNMRNMGELSDGELLSALSEGGLGLVWYRDAESRRCMEYGISFSLAQYLAAGVPVIVPAGIANETLIDKNHLGIVVHSLDEAVAVIESMTEAEYQRYVQCVGQFARSLRDGYYTKKCLIDAVQAVCRKDGGEISIPTNIYELGEQTFTYTALKESYGENLALSWNYLGKADGFLIYDMYENLLYETRDVHQHYFLIKGYARESGFVIKAYIATLKGKMIIAESGRICLQETRYNHAEISLIIPAYNVQDCIVRSIDSALAQSVSDLEIIIVDDGSADQTSEIIDWYAEKYSNVAAIHQANEGAAAARNRGIRHAQGSYIGFLDSDDMIYPNMLARLYDTIRKNDCDIAITSAYWVEGSDSKVFIQYALKEDTAITFDEFFSMHYIKECGYGVVIWNKLYRASLVKEHLFPILKAEDEAWTPYILSYADRICYLDDRSYEYNRTNSNPTLSDKVRNRSEEDVFNSYKDTVIFYLKNGNQKRIGLLKELAKVRLQGRERVYRYEGYGRLRKEIDEKLLINFEEQ